MTPRVIAAYQDSADSYIVVLDDGRHLWRNDRLNAWETFIEPLPPEALGEVEEEVRRGGAPTTDLSAAAQTLLAALRDDADYRRSWLDNLACAATDEGVAHDTAQRIASRFLGFLGVASPTTEPDLGEWPGRPEVPPDTSRDIEILTSHGAFRGYHSSRYGWCTYSADRNNCAPVDPRDVLRWRELPRAVVEDGRVTGVTRG